MILGPAYGRATREPGQLFAGPSVDSSISFDDLLTDDIQTVHRPAIAPLGADDAVGFVAYRQDPDVARWQGWEPTYSDVEVAQLIASQPSADLPDRGGSLQLAIAASV